MSDCLKADFSLTAKHRSVIFGTMKVETTIAIEADLLEQVKNAAKDFRSRSEVFEKALREYLPKLNQKPAKRKLTREEEIDLINRYADEHREEILETLSYQIDL
jgi:metal-responsive CopG/Arc/MetJ family transcriptional regulator